MDLLDRFFNQHKGVRRLALLWIVGLVTYMVVVKIDFATVNTAGGVVASAVIGLVGTVIVFYGKGRESESTDDTSNSSSNSV